MGLLSLFSADYAVVQNLVHDIQRPEVADSGGRRGLQNGLRFIDILPALKGKDSFPGCRIPYSLGYTTLASGGGCHNPNYWA